MKSPTSCIVVQKGIINNIKYKLSTSNMCTTKLYLLNLTNCVNIDKNI